MIGSLLQPRYRRLKQNSSRALRDRILDVRPWHTRPLSTATARFGASLQALASCR
jgi:hypothetical protein